MANSDLIVGMDIREGSSQICFYDFEEKQTKAADATDTNYIFDNDIIFDTVDEKQMAKHMEYLLTTVCKSQNMPRPKRIGVTFSRYDNAIIAKAKQAVALLGYSKQATVFISHEECFAYFAYYQKKELYANGVLLFDYQKDGLHTQYLTAIRKKGMILIPQESHIYQSEPLLSVVQKKAALQDVEEELTNMVQDVLKEHSIATLYLTGDGFDVSAYPKNFTQAICARRKVFAGQNLFVKGACLAALEGYLTAQGTKSVFSDKVLACKNRITTGIELDIAEHGVAKRLRILKPGCNYVQAERTLEFILDDVSTISLLIRPCDEREDYVENIDLHAIPYREGKTTRVSMEFIFDSDSTGMVRIRDLGFGEFVKSSGVVVEQNIQL